MADHACARARVIVADDHRRALHAATSMLSQRYDVMAAVTNGEAAIEAARLLDPDIVVLDIAMPDLDGLQTAERIRASGSRAAIVFLSTHADPDFAAAAMLQGARAFVAKTRMTLDLEPAVAHAHAGRAFIAFPGVLPQWERPPDLPRHDLQLYTTGAYLAEAVAAYFDSALDAGHSMMSIATPEHQHAIDTALAKRGIEVDTLLAGGRYCVMDSAAALDAVCRGGRPDAECWKAAVEPLLERGLRAATGSQAHFSMFGETAPILGRRGDLDNMDRLEAIAGEYAASRPMSILCGYSTTLVGDHRHHVGARVCRLHATIVPADPGYLSPA
jgi:DNA-binding NarL/FixJ family response regulator